MNWQRQAAASLIFAALITVGCSESAAPPEPVRPVRALKVGDLKAIQGRQFPGRAKAKEEVDLSFQVSGPLITLSVDVGSEVKKGDIIAVIDPRDFQAALESAQGNLQQAQAQLSAMEKGARPEEIEQLRAAVAEAEALNRQAVAEQKRLAPLVPTGAITQSEYDIARARSDTTAAQIAIAKENLNIGLKGARLEDLEAKRSEIKALEAAVATARNKLDYSTLTAPFDGVVAARNVDNFQTVQAKEPIVRLLDASKIEVTVQVPERLISLVPQVKKAACRFDAFQNQEFIGDVTKIGSEASLTTRTYPVTVQIDQPEGVQILPGMAATVRGLVETVEGEAAQELIVPLGAVFAGEEGQQSYVWVVDEGSEKVSKRAVQIGPLTIVGQVVTEGLEPGEWVVTRGVNSLRENQQVKILQEAAG